MEGFSSYSRPSSFPVLLTLPDTPFATIAIAAHFATGAILLLLGPHTIDRLGAREHATASSVARAHLRVHGTDHRNRRTRFHRTQWDNRGRANERGLWPIRRAHGGGSV